MIPDLYLAPERDKPEVDFKFSRHHLSLKGETYPENAAQFYGPILAALRAYLNDTRGAHITVDMDLIYFNSSSTKILLSLFEMLDQAARDNQVQLNWHYDPEDETVQEFGADLAEDYTALVYNPVAK
ncbi:DUF1987 domain-containing protein [Azovibrio restrictus]|uniref:DUF1987 domain-containing protein n=1 Tax=Azovibrio restrictus TaxID=146938 RepID=UPI0026F1CAC9|nr:DUF1987 domain-containing protein [Azovibrio restrictus]MDD3481727.1 DUF1987 domain-containing protein [Azovibrio restrictus]